MRTRNRVVHMSFAKFKSLRSK